MKQRPTNQLSVLIVGSDENTSDLSDYLPAVCSGCLYFRSLELPAIAANNNTFEARKGDVRHVVRPEQFNVVYIGSEFSPPIDADGAIQQLVPHFAQATTIVVSDAHGAIEGTEPLDFTDNHAIVRSMVAALAARKEPATTFSPKPLSRPLATKLRHAAWTGVALVIAKLGYPTEVRA